MKITNITISANNLSLYLNLMKTTKLLLFLLYIRQIIQISIINSLYQSIYFSNLLTMFFIFISHIQFFLYNFAV